MTRLFRAMHSTPPNRKTHVNSIRYSSFLSPFAIRQPTGLCSGAAGLIWQFSGKKRSYDRRQPPGGGKWRRTYIAALKAADNDDLGLLIDFACSLRSSNRYLRQSLCEGAHLDEQLITGSVPER